MLNVPMDVLKQYPIRKTRQQKRAFGNAVQAYVSSLGYTFSFESGHFGCRNLIMGDPEKASVLVVAHYDTCARMPVPNIITPCNFWCFLVYQLFLTVLIAVAAIAVGFLVELFWGVSCVSIFAGIIVFWIILLLLLFGPSNPENANDNTSGVVTLLEIMRTLPKNQRHKVCFVLFDLEEVGLWGSAAYRKAHRCVINRQIVLNLDCVGDGDHITMFPTKALKKDRKLLTTLYKACGYFGCKSLTLYESRFSIYPSDQMNFPYGVGICALKKGKAGFYLSRIHTPKDTILEETNINILRAALTTYICCSAVQFGKDEFVK